jgi:hypothetical protein
VFIINLKKEYLLKSIFGFEEDVGYMNNGRILELNDLMPRGIHRIIKFIKLRGGNLNNTKENMCSEEFNDKVHKYLKRRRGPYEEAGMNQLVCEDLKLFENLVKNGFMKEVIAIILGKWWILKDEMLFIIEKIREKVDLKEVKYEIGDSDPKEENLNAILMTGEQFVCNLLIEVSKRNVEKVIMTP